MNMYCNCGSIDRAREIFDRFLPIVDRVAYSTIMKAYLANNQPAQVLSLFHQLQSSSVSPDPLLYLNVIHACRQLGLAHEAENIHRSIPPHVIEKSPAIQMALIDMHANCSQLPEADRLLRLLEQKENHFS
jgi:pentatricopeptide repeat protein